MIPHGYTIIQSNALPMPATAKACDIHTKEEITVATGEEIHALADKQNRLFYVSKEVFNDISGLNIK